MEYFLYALPLIPIMIVSWFVQHVNNRYIIKMSEVETELPANLVARKIIETSALTGIPVEKGEDYTQNVFDEESKKILLSPDIFDQKDITSLGLASQAAGMAVLQSQTPEKAKSLKKVRTTVLIIFWIVFTILAFGLMGKNLPTVLVGYGLFLLMILLYFVEIRMKFGINKLVREKLDEMKIFSENELNAITKVLKAETIKL